MAINRPQDLPFMGEPEVLKTTEQRLLPLGQMIENGISRAVIHCQQRLFWMEIFLKNF